MKRFIARQSGQAMVLAVLALGVVLATFVMFGSKRVEDLSVSTGRLEDAGAAYEALGLAAKRVQNMYVNDSACDPETLNLRLSQMANLPASVSNIGGILSSQGYAPAQPSFASSNANRFNRCTASTGCRQLAVPISGWVYIVTVGGVGSDADDATRVGDCPRDVSVRMHTAVNGNVYIQWVTLTNLCSIASCGSGGGSRGFDGLALTLTTTMTSSACTGTNNNIPSRKYGTGFLKAPENVSGYMTTNMLRFYRRYLETGGADIGETPFLYTTNGVIAANTNGSCTPAQSASQCSSVNCFPFLDLNRDGNNNEQDLAIMENFMRGYLSSLPVNELN